MFYGSDQGGGTAAVLTSLVATCKRLCIDPFAYLRDLFGRIAAHPKATSPSCSGQQLTLLRPAR
jgi:hypothetical protein